MLCVAALVAGAGACESTLPLTADATTPPTITTISPIGTPDWAGKQATPFDGFYEGYLINESYVFFCGLGVPSYSRLAFDVSKGLVRRAENAAQASPVDGYVNRHGVFVANTSLKFALGQLFIGTIAADHMDGTWRSSGRLCHGRFELVRVTGAERYCLDRLSGKPYSTPSECRGIDKYLTAGEFRSLQSGAGKTGS
jgi:hypothetical protein